MKKLRPHRNIPTCNTNTKEAFDKYFLYPYIYQFQPGDPIKILEDILINKNSSY